MIIGTSSNACSNPLPRKLNAVTTCASGRLNSVVNNVVSAAIRKLLRRASRCSGLENKIPKY